MGEQQATEFKKKLNLGYQNISKSKKEEKINWMTNMNNEFQRSKKNMQLKNINQRNSVIPEGLSKQICKCMMETNI